MNGGGVVCFLLKRQPANNLTNWRPVCLLRVAYKIYAKVINSRLRRIAEKYGLLEFAQEGFRSRRNCQRQVERLCSLLASARSKRLSVFLTYVDFSNAFNSVDHQCLIKVLKMLGIPDTDLIQDMLRDSTFWSVNNIGTTAKIPLSRGVKQGAV